MIGWRRIIMMGEDIRLDQLETTGKRIWFWRRSLGITQSELLTRTRKLGLDFDQASLSRVENNKQRPTGPLIGAIAKILGVSADYLLMNTDDPTPPNDDDEQDGLGGERAPYLAALSDEGFALAQLYDEMDQEFQSVASAIMHEVADLNARLRQRDEGLIALATELSTNLDGSAMRSAASILRLLDRQTVDGTLQEALNEG